MAKYSELEENEIQELAVKYDLDLVDYEPIEGGAGNTSYLLRARKSEYVLTIFEITMSRVVDLSKLLLVLEENEFPTTRLLYLADGGTVTINQGKPVLVKPYISGQVVKNLNGAMLMQVGAVMARLHEIPVPRFLPDKHVYGLQTFPRIMGHNIDPEYETWLAKKYTFLKKNIPSSLPRGLIHGDLFYDNVLFEEEEFKAVIDFEEACQYYKVFDLGMAIVGLCMEDTRVRLDKVQAFVHGYQQSRKLEEREKESLQIFAEYAAIATSSWRYWKYNIDTPIAEKAKKHWQMVRIANEISVFSKEVFFETVFN